MHDFEFVYTRRTKIHIKSHNGTVLFESACYFSLVTNIMYERPVRFTDAKICNALTFLKYMPFQII